jgi:hypothetical protein
MNKTFVLGVAVFLTLPLLGCAAKTKVVQSNPSPVTVKFDKNGDGIIDRIDWRRMKDAEKSTYARMSLEEIGENPDAIVKGKKTREMLLLEGLEAVYGK